MTIAFAVAVLVGFLSIIIANMFYHDSLYYKEMAEQYCEMYDEVLKEYLDYRSEIVNNLEENGNKEETNI